MNPSSLISILSERVANWTIEGRQLVTKPKQRGAEAIVISRERGEGLGFDYWWVFRGFSSLPAVSVLGEAEVKISGLFRKRVSIEGAEPLKAVIEKVLRDAEYLSLLLKTKPDRFKIRVESSKEGSVLLVEASKMSVDPYVGNLLRRLYDLVNATCRLLSEEIVKK